MGGGAETGDSDQIACEEDAVNGCAASSDTLDKSDSDEEDVRDDEHAMPANENDGGPSQELTAGKKREPNNESGARPVTGPVPSSLSWRFRCRPSVRIRIGPPFVGVGVPGHPPVV